MLAQKTYKYNIRPTRKVGLVFIAHETWIYPSAFFAPPRRGGLRGINFSSMFSK